MRRMGIVVGLILLLPACGWSAARVEGGQGAPGPTPTTVAAPAETPTSADPEAVGTIEVAPYFFVDEPGHPKRTGPFLIPVAREVEATEAVARRSIEELFSGPHQEDRESVPALSSAIPDGVELLGLTIGEGTAVIDLSSEFAIEDDSAAVAARVAQVVFTLTRFDSVDRVLFLQEGVEVMTPTADGSLVGGAVTRGDYLQFAAAISVETPIYGGKAAHPLRVTGFATVFEATFQYALTDEDGLIVEEGVAMTGNGMGWGSFDFTIDYRVDGRQRGALIVWAHSAEDGSRIDVREHPVILNP